MRLIFVQRWTLNKNGSFSICRISMYDGYDGFYSNDHLSDCNFQINHLKQLVVLVFSRTWPCISSSGDGLQTSWNFGVTWPQASPFSPQKPLLFLGFLLVAETQGWLDPCCSKSIPGEKTSNKRCGRESFHGQRVARLEMPGVDGIHALSESLTWELGRAVWHRGWPSGTSRQRNESVNLLDWFWYKYIIYIYISN